MYITITVLMRTYGPPVAVPALDLDLLYLITNLYNVDRPYSGSSFVASCSLCCKIILHSLVVVLPCMPFKSIDCTLSLANNFTERLHTIAS